MPGSKYWKKRMLAIEKQKNQMSIECVQAAEKQFNIAKKNIEKDLARWYIRLADNNDISLAEAKKLLDKKELEEFKWTVDEYIKKGELIKYHPEWEQQLENASARVHISRLESIKLQLQQETELLYGRFNEDINKHLKDIYENGYYRTAFEIQKGYGIGYSLHQLDSRKIDIALRTAWAQDGSNFSDRIWQQKNKLVNELNTVLVQNVIRGKDVEKSITDMAKKLDVSKTSAGRLVMTESAAIHAKSQHECFKELDVEEFEFVATLDMKTSEICREMDGKHFKMSEYEIGITVPPLHPWCRSVTVPYFSDDFEDIMGKRAARGENGKTYYVPADMTYPEWKETFINDKDEIANSTKSDTINSGAVSGARNPYGDKAKEHAIRYYNSVRKMKTDVDKISKTTGISKSKIQEIKNFIFLDRHNLGGKEPEYFEPDYMMAESWRRLIDGKPEPHDIIMLKHELMEKELMKKGMSQEEAHIVTSQKYNYDKEATEFYGKIKKYRKE